MVGDVLAADIDNPGPIISNDNITPSGADINRNPCPCLIHLGFRLRLDVIAE